MCVPRSLHPHDLFLLPRPRTPVHTRIHIRIRIRIRRLVLRVNASTSAAYLAYARPVLALFPPFALGEALSNLTYIQVPTVDLT